jgi:hypothetical protein
MKKLIIIVLVLFLGAEVSHAQFNLGIKAGYTASKLSSDVDVIKAQAASGFHVGAWARIGKKLYLQPEFIYNLGSSVFRNDVDTSNWKQKVTVNTINIPALVGFKLLDLKAVNLRLMAGPEISFVVNSKVKDMNSVVGPITTDDVNKVNWYLQAGAGVDVLFLTLDIRYVWGINQMINDVKYDFGSTTTPYPLNSHHNMFLVSLGWKFF